jgi:hypothetical protein
MHPSLHDRYSFTVARVAALLPALIALSLPTRLFGQDAGWHSVVEANASTLFGATSQTLTAFAAAVSHNGDGFSADAQFKFRYGESEDEQKVKFVNARAVSVAPSNSRHGAGSVHSFCSPARRVWSRASPVGIPAAPEQSGSSPNPARVRRA